MAGVVPEVSRYPSNGVFGVVKAHSHLQLQAKFCPCSVIRSLYFGCKQRHLQSVASRVPLLLARRHIKLEAPLGLFQAEARITSHTLPRRSPGRAHAIPSAFLTASLDTILQ